MNMKTPSAQVVLARVDNRLVHGQVGVIWTRHVDATSILVVDDYIAQDYFQQEVMNKTVGSQAVPIHYCSVDKASNHLDKHQEERILLITKDVSTMRKLVDANLPIQKVNLGIMHRSLGKHKYINEFIYVDHKDIEDIQKIKEQGITVTANIIPQAEEIIV